MSPFLLRAIAHGYKKLPSPDPPDPILCISSFHVCQILQFDPCHCQPLRQNHLGQ